jgi:hypothetical protein
VNHFLTSDRQTSPIRWARETPPQGQGKKEGKKGQSAAWTAKCSRSELEIKNVLKSPLMSRIFPEGLVLQEEPEGVDIGNLGPFRDLTAEEIKKCCLWGRFLDMAV